MKYFKFELNQLARSLDMSTNLTSSAYDTLIDFSLKVDLSRPLKTNLNVKFAPLWNVWRSCFNT